MRLNDAVVVCARSDLRRRLRLFGALALLLGLLGGALIAAVAGARRTDSAFDRMLVATEAGDAYIEICNESFSMAECTASSPEATEALRTTAGVRDLVTLDRHIGILVSDDGTVVQAECESGIGQVEVLASTDPRYGAAFHRPLIVEGRAPDPTRRDEIAISPALADSGVEVGDTISSELSAYCTEDPSPARTSIDLEVVGVAVEWGGLRLEGRQTVRLAYATPAFAAWAEREGVDRYQTAMIRLEPGTTMDDLADAGPPLFPLLTRADTAESVARGVDPDVLVLWLIAGVGLVGALVVLGPTLARIERELRSDQLVLQAIGFRRSELRRIGALHGLALAVVAVPVAIVVAIGLSGLTPIGEAGRFEPNPGTDVDGFVLLVGVLVLSVVPAALLAACSARRIDHTVPLRPTTRRVADVALSTGASPRGVLGLRLAFDPPPGSTLGLGGRLVAQVLGIAAVVAAVTFAAGLDRLTTSPSLAGWNWDLLELPETTTPDEFTATVLAHPDVERATAGTFFAGNCFETECGDDAIALGVGRADTYLLTFGTGDRAVAPTIIAGRAPARTDEVVVHPTLLRELDADIGDVIPATLGDASVDLTIVGTSVEGAFPQVVEQGAAMTYAGLEALWAESGVEDELAPEVVYITLQDDVDPAVFRSELVDAGLLGPFPPGGGPEAALDSLGLGTVDRVPKVLGGLMFLLAAAVLAYLVADRVRSSVGDIAVHRVLGFTGRDTRRAVLFASGAVTAVVLVAAIPVGVAVGRLSWLSYARNLGVKPVAVVPLAELALVALVVLAVANAAAFLPGRDAARRPVAALIRHD